HAGRINGSRRDPQGQPRPRSDRASQPLLPGPRRRHGDAVGWPRRREGCRMTQAASSYARIEGDKYFTPTWVTEALLSVEHFEGRACDPAAGAGHIVDACIAGGLDAYGFDL